MDSNRFSVFQSEMNDDSETNKNLENSEVLSKEISSSGNSQEVCESSNQEQFPASNSGLNYWKSSSVGSWADAEEEYEEDFQPFSSPKNHKNLKPPRKIENSHSKQQSENKDRSADNESIRKMDMIMRNFTEVRIPYKTRVLNKETGEFDNRTNTRTLRVISQQYFEQLQRLISKFKTHRGPNRDYYDAKEQKSKIKLANELLNSCAKNKNEPCSFVYAVATIYTRDKNGDKKTFIQNEIYPESKCYFECDTLTYRFQTLPNLSE